MGPHQVPKNISSNTSPYNNQSNASSALPPKFPKQHSYDTVSSQQNLAKISRLPKGEDYEQSLIFASSKGTSRITNSKQNELDEIDYFKSNNFK